jgi:hypothetical protein
MWQKCPICNGKGTKEFYEELNVNYFSNTCHTCKGSGIISELTGLPPDYVRVGNENIHTSKEQHYQEYFDSPIMLKK